MRTTSQIMIISAHLGFLEDRRHQLQTQIDYLLTVIEICKSWLEEKEDNSLSFEEIMLKCLEIARNDNPGTNPYTKVDEVDQSRLMVKVSNTNSSFSSHSDIVNILGSLSRNLYEQNNKIDILTKLQSENFEEFHEKINSLNLSMLSKDPKHRLSIRSSYNAIEESSSVSDLKMLTESSVDYIDTGSEVPLGTHNFEIFSSSVDLPKAVSKCSENQFKDSVKEDFIALNLKLEKIAAQIKEFTERKNHTNKFVGFTAFVSIFGQLVNPSSQFISSVNDYGRVTDDPQRSNYNILTCFNTVQHNEDDHYDPHTGIFKVPYDGFYLTCLNVNIISQGPVFIGTVQRTNGYITDFRELDCVVVKLGSAQSLNILRLNKDDELCVYKATDKSRICDRSRFSCFMISSVP